MLPCGAASGSFSHRLLRHHGFHVGCVAVVHGAGSPIDRLSRSALTLLGSGAATERDAFGSGEVLVCCHPGQLPDRVAGRYRTSDDFVFSPDGLVRIAGSTRDQLTRSLTSRMARVAIIRDSFRAPSVRHLPFRAQLSVTRPRRGVGVRLHRYRWSRLRLSTARPGPRKNSMRIHVFFGVFI